MLRSPIIPLLFIPFVCYALDDSVKCVAWNIVFDRGSTGNRSTIDTLRQVCTTWRDRIDLKQKYLFTNFPLLTEFKGLASSLVFNSHNEWCGVGKYKAVNTLVFGNQGNWCATPLEEKHNIAPWHTKPTIISTQFHRKSAFFIPDCYIIPQDLELHVFWITPEMRACKKTYPRCFRICNPIVSDIGKTPRLTLYIPDLKVYDKRFEAFFLLQPFLSNSYIGEGCFCLADKPSQACKAKYDTLVHAAQEEELEEPVKQKVISTYLAHHISSQCTHKSFDDFKYTVMLNSRNRIFFGPKKDGGQRDSEWFNLLPLTNATAATTWEEAIITIQKQAAAWQCKNNFVYRCSPDEESTAVSIINVNTSPTIAHNLSFPYPNCTVQDIFFNSTCAYIYLSSATKAYLITWPHDFIKKRKNSCYRDKSKKKRHELMEYTVQRADIQQIGDDSKLIDKLLENVAKDEMHTYALPSPELIIDWQSIQFVADIKIRDCGGAPYLGSAELSRLIQLPDTYAKHLENQPTDISECPQKLRNAFTLVCAPFLDYELMGSAFKTDYMHERPFFSDYVYLVAAACALWPWQTAPTVRTIGFGAITRYISSGFSTRIINELRYREMSSQQRTFFKTYAYTLSPLPAIFSSYLCSVLLNSSPYLGIFSPMIWGLFDGLCILNSDAMRRVSCTYTSLWSSRWAQLYRWYHKKS